jgi:hypothetical protein
MSWEIGENAGKVWQYLNQNGRQSFNALCKATKLKPREADRALGWLAREGKVAFEKEKNAEMISLISS